VVLAASSLARASAAPSCAFSVATCACRAVTCHCPSIRARPRTSDVCDTGARWIEEGLREYAVPGRFGDDAQVRPSTCDTQRGAVHC
jgi:hypothetical protein